ncbi:sphingosine kinase [Saccharopolyspora erythraea]|uniref:diacylglycerol/lipid kinase family protein n=1 Tax=Saccharopolyspora erythraea TaxID=1836 RepID=UPI001BAAAB36|nr:diacylglycerol kinase family protein [Saccharopolyspora erythraea]QUH01772.1 sphingosine kinase [Saccharopolyspora erythraea]
MRSVLVINPAAGGGLAAKVAGAVAGHLRAVSQVRVVVAPDAAATSEAAAEAVAAGVDVLAVLGGDGVVNLALQSCARSSTALAVIPAGTGNDLARALDVPSNPVLASRAVAEAMTRGERRRIDLGRVVGGGWFATVLCAGFDSMVSARANRMRWPRGRRRYDLAVLRELAGLRPMPLRVETASEVLELDACWVAVGNTAWYGSGIPICPDADSSDGEFDVTVVGEVSRRELLRILPGMRSGEHVRHPAVRTLRAAAVRLGGDNGWFAYADGEPQARLPVGVRCEQAALQVVGPR